MTWGAGLASEERYTNLAASELNKQFPGLKIEILNFGVSGGPTVIERDILLRYAPLINPDLIVVGFCMNDPLPHMQSDYIERDIFLNKIRKVTQPIVWIGLSRTREFILNEIILKTAVAVGILPSWFDAVDKLYDKKSNEWKSFINALKDIKKISDQHNLPPPVFLVLNQAVYSDKAAAYRDLIPPVKRALSWYHQAEDAAKELGFVTFNYEKEISELPADTPLVINKLDGHPSAVLNKIYAAKLVGYITLLLREKIQHD